MREVKGIHICGCRCNERRKANTDGSTCLAYTGLLIKIPHSYEPLFIMSHLARGTEASLADLGLNMEDFQTAGVIQDFNKVPKK